MLRLKNAARAAALLLLAAGCSGDAGSPLASDAGPTATISDAAHAGAVPGFYFLPPMVPSPSYSGTFDAALEPRVEVCELSGTSCGALVAQFTFGTGPNNVRVDAASQQYAVNWNTSLSNLDPAKHYRISVFVGTLRLGYADVDVVSSGKELKNVDTQEYIPLVDDRTLPIKFRIETGIAGLVVVSPAVDTVEVGETTQFTATITDLHGNPLPGPAVTWTSSNPAIATIDGNGLATGVAPGTVTITASIGYLSGDAQLTVEQNNTPPVANPDTFDAIGNVTVPVPAPGVLANDTDGENDALQAVAGTFPTTAGGTVTINADGSFSYLSAPGFTGTDTFDYTVTDGAAADTGTVTMTVATRVWYVSNAAAAPGDGRDASPFATLKQAETASAAGETIFLLYGDGTTVGYDEGIVLKAGQVLTGQGIAADVEMTLNGETIVLLAAGNSPTVARTTSGATIALATNNTVQGLNVTSVDGAGIAGSGFGTFTAGSIGFVSANGGAAVDLENGTVTATFGSLSSNGSTGAGVRLANVGGSVQATGDGSTAGSGGTIDNAAGDGVTISGTVAVTLRLMQIEDVAGDGVDVSGAASVTLDRTAVLRTGGHGVLAVPSGGAGLTVNVENSTFTNIQGSSLHFLPVALSSGTSSVRFVGNTVTTTVAGKGGRVFVGATASTTTDVTITDNAFTGVSGAGVVNVDAGDAATVRGTIARNQISNAQAVGIVVSVDDGGLARLVVDANQITSVGSDGIQAANFGGAGTSQLDLVVTDNVINGHNTNPAAAFLAGIVVFGFEDNICLALTGNSVSGTPAGYEGVYLENGGGTFQYEEVPNTAATGTVTPAFVLSQNTVGSASVNGAVTLSDGVACPRP